jgi:hypothetical protein
MFFKKLKRVRSTDGLTTLERKKKISKYCVYKPPVTGRGLSQSLNPPCPCNPRPALHSDPASFAHHYQLANYLLPKNRGCLKKVFSGKICKQIYA